MAEEKITKKAELREKAEALVKSYNEAVQNGKFDVSAKLNDEIEQTVNEYTAISRLECFNALKSTEDPMLEAVKALVYPSIRAKDTKQGDEKIPVRTIEDTEKPIDLLKLHKHIGGDGIGKDKNWAYMIEKLNFLMTARVCKELNIDPKILNDSYAMSEISKQMEIGKDVTSNTNLLKSLTLVVSAMIGSEYKPLSHDVNFLNRIYSRKNHKALTVSCANHKYMRQYVMEICHRIVCNEVYNAEFKRIQK